MSMFSAQFLRNLDRFLGVEGEPTPDVHFHPHGYLMCASSDGAAVLEENYNTQLLVLGSGVLVSIWDM